MVLSLHQDEHSSFDILDDAECRWLLEHTHLGRVGVTLGALPAIFPVNYTTRGGSIYFRCDRGTKFAAACRGAAVAFQIDAYDVQYHHGWSVLAVGLAEDVHDPEATELRDVLELEPWAPGPHDHLVRISPEFVSGRRIGWPHAVPRPWASDVDA